MRWTLCPSAAVLAVALLCGCLPQVVRGPIADSRQAINLHPARTHGRVCVEGQGCLDAQGVQVDVDTTTWVDPATGALVGASTGQVTHVVLRSRRRGALNGVGLALGVLTAAWVSERVREGGTIWEDQVGGFAFFGALGVLGGAAAGATIGVSTRFVDGPPLAPGDTSNRPPARP